MGHLSTTKSTYLPTFCVGPEEDIGHMRLLCARDEEVAGLLCRRLEEFTAELPLTDRAVEFVAWREHGCRWTESLMAGVVPGDLKRLFAAVRAASSRGPAKARLFVEDMVQIGEDVYARRNHRLTQIMQLPMQDRRRAVYAFLRADTPFCPPAGRIQQRPPWNPFAGLPGDLLATFQRALLHTLLVPRSCIAQEEAMSLFPSLDGGGGAGLQPVDWFLGGGGHHDIQGVVPRGIGAILGPGACYHGEKP